MCNPIDIVSGLAGVSLPGAVTLHCPCGLSLSACWTGCCLGLAWPVCQCHLCGVPHTLLYGVSSLAFAALRPAASRLDSGNYAGSGMPPHRVDPGSPHAHTQQLGSTAASSIRAPTCDKSGTLCPPCHLFPASRPRTNSLRSSFLPIKSSCIPRKALSLFYFHPIWTFRRAHQQI